MDPVNPQGAALPPMPAASTKRGHPLFATIVGSAVVVASLATNEGGSPGPVSDRLALALGMASGSALLVWGIAYFVTIRHASSGWKIGSLLVMLILGFLASLFQLGGAAVRAERENAADAERARQIALHPEEAGRLGDEAGPASRMVAALMDKVSAETAAFSRKSEAAGLAQIVTLKDLTPNSPALGHCERFDGLAEEARQVGTHWPAHLAAARAAGSAAGLGPADLDDFARAASKSGYADVWNANGDFMSGAAERCRFLATHRWRAEGGKAMFERKSDASEFNAMSDRLEQLSRQQQRRAAASKAALSQPRAG